MINRLIHIDPNADESLQGQIRKKMVEGILVGSFPSSSKLPSSRKLAKQLNVSRNTIVLVYQTLIDEGYINKSTISSAVSAALFVSFTSTSTIAAAEDAAVKGKVEIIEVMRNRRTQPSFYSAAIKL